MNGFKGAILTAYHTFIFDLDGTLLDTMPDLVNVTNTALRACGYPERSYDEIHSYVGNGQRALMMQAVPAGSTEKAVDEALACWKKIHAEIGIKLTKPYPHMAETLAQLKSRGYKLAVLSNKFDAGVHDIIPRYFPGVFDLMYGECEGIPRKPDPAGLLRAIDELGAAASECVYVGDSAGDMKVSLAAKCLPVGVNWGYNSVESIEAAGAKTIIESPLDLLEFAPEK